LGKPSATDRRKHVLKERKAELLRTQNRQEAEMLLDEAIADYRHGDHPAAERLLRKILVLDPQCSTALNVLSFIHEQAGHFAEALSYAQQEYKITGSPGALFNVAVLNNRLNRYGPAAESFREFLAKAESADPQWADSRRSAESILGWLLTRTAAGKAAQPRTEPRREELKPKPPAPPPVAPPPPKPQPELPRVTVEFTTAPATAVPPSGDIADFFLRRRWLGLRLAQSFEELLCLPSLNGVDSYIYQHETVRRVLRHFKGRALLADEVGLGKTIEACLILKEYWTRGMARRVLILTPPSLVSQWKGELLEKFGLAAESPDGAEFRRDPEQFWKSQPAIVASIALARLEPHAPALAAAPWDMVIVDEAHCLKNRDSANWRLVDSLQKKFMLLLTATPVENNLLELYNLITLLKPGLLATEGEFRKQHVSGKSKTPKNPEQLRGLLGEVMIRNTRAAADVQLPHRIAATVTVEPSETEARIYEAASRFVADRYRQRDRKRISPMTLHQLQRQAGSSPVTLGRFAARALAESDGFPAADRRELETILDLCATVDQSSKGEQLGRMLAGHSGKTVVFTEFLPTLDYLARVCERHGIPFASFSGDLSRAAKDAAIALFRDHARVLLSTGSGGEGRNLQFADTVINFDLPWNPMRIEQRVGRVHRIGQTHDVFVFNFCQKGAIEEQLLRVLHDKINMFELVVGEMDAILGSMDDGRDFAEIVMDLWLSGRESGAMEQAFEALSERLITAKKQHADAKKLDDTLFARDFEV
jgi:superfamily II DNA or RNA helicase